MIDKDSDPTFFSKMNHRFFTSNSRYYKLNKLKSKICD
ncbi:hypothetical protein LEP1GSC059_0943 [Leptospira noguchii serovar Panama str. CZ214]|uniref:Uncharacterized protein n=1 Tax=Leptospira noguchii serovar Panama str. CZ214 TaxID=1001595 RepID=T0GS99_9LEPT|nr:hypothetical protein LEP1GSC059_0943 [Leptospira noguchii serovar Panama str. CZ214]